MFNILLILAGVLEYVLLGINFHVRLRVLAFDKLFDWLSQPVIPPLPSLQENFQNTYLGGILIAVALPQCVHRVLSSPEVRSYPRVFPRDDPAVLQGCQRLDAPYRPC